MIDVGGEVDLYTAPTLRERLIATIDDGAQKILVDLTDVAFMDSSGLGVLVGALKRARERGGELALVCREGPTFKVLSVTGLDRVFTLFDSVEAAGA